MSRDRIEAAFQAARAELEIRSGFPPEVEAAARHAADRPWSRDGRAELTALPWITIDPPGSRDLDQALHIEDAADGGHRVRYAIADVACWVPRGGPVEAEAWRRGVTYYAPDRRETLYPPALSEGAASLLPGGDRPAVVFTLDLDGAGALVGTRVERAVVRSHAQLTYGQVRDVVEGGGGDAAGPAAPFAGMLRLLRRVGELRAEQERQRGGVSLPILDQHVERREALRLGYQLGYEEPNVAEEWNAQISLLAGHAAAQRMLAAGVGMLRTSPPAGPRDVERVRTVALALGFAWPEETPYPEFMRSLEPRHPALPTLVWQARRLMRGADYVAFRGEPPEQPLHSALRMTYAHCTAPLRRLGDRYVLDLLVALEAGRRPTEPEVEALFRLPAVLDEAERRASQLERRVVDVAEAWTLRDGVGRRFPALVLAADHRWVEVQLADPPIRARIPADGAAAPVGGTVTVRVAAVEPDAGRVELELAPA